VHVTLVEAQPAPDAFVLLDNIPFPRFAANRVDRAKENAIPAPVAFDVDVDFGARFNEVDETA
jgi:hypothetical protein